MKLTAKQKAALTDIARAAVRVEAETGVPAELTTAQCCLESGFLKHSPGNNPFGMKKRPRHTKQQVLMTTEVRDGVAKRLPQTFAAFDSLEDAFRDYAWLISCTDVYANAWKQYQADRKVLYLITGVAKKYATDPKYGEKVGLLALGEDLQTTVMAERKTFQEGRSV